MRNVFVILLFLTAFALFGQGSFYQSPQNQYYWKNRNPKPGYWQQDVHYQLKANLKDETDIVDANEALRYTNNSPDTLHELYFHLYQNAFQPESYAAQLEKANGVKTKFGHYEAQKLGTQVEQVSIGRVEMKPTFDNTIMKIVLDQPLFPGASIDVQIKFKSYFDQGSMRRRMKMFKNYGFKHYDCVHWYPRICVYDAKFGWETDQHLGKEFYGDYGAFDGEITLPSHYVLEATGALQNKSEVLPDEYRERIDVKNYKTLPRDAAGQYRPNVNNPANGTTKTWKFHADNVHDFAWTADPLYRIIETTWNGIQCVGLAEEFNAPGWQDAAEFVAKVIKTYSEDFGMYAYPKMVAADARDGMEYPMLTLDGGSSPGYHGLIAHEIGHNWFFGMVGNNETYRAALDEGFTQFLTSWSLRKLDGEYPISSKSDRKYYEHFKEVNPTVVSNVYWGYLADAMNWNDEPLNTHSDQFNGALGHGGGYRHVYYKTATMLYNLQYTLGDELFQNAMKHYFNQWKICHPYMEDFRNSMIQFTHTDLNWFFDQWMETTKRNDYSIVSVKEDGEKEGIYKITFKRLERMQMPLDFTVTSKSGQVYHYTIPNTYFAKQEVGTMVLPMWKGWDNLNETYTASVNISGDIKNVVIDPSHRLADVNYLNNSWKCPVKFRFDAQIKQPNDLYNYRAYWRPDFWGNSIDGLKLGVNFRGHYLNQKHIFNATVWYNSSILNDRKDGLVENPVPVSYRVSYKSLIAKNIYWNVGSKWLDGLFANQIGISKTLNNGALVNAQYKSMYRRVGLDAAYVNGQWTAGNNNNFIDVTYENNKVYNGQRANLNYQFQLRSASFLTDYAYSYIQLKAINTNNLGKFELKTRFLARVTSGATPIESKLYLAGASPEEMMESKFTRAPGFWGDTWNNYTTNTGNFQAGGGLNLRGYAGYVAPEIQNGTVVPFYQGNNGVALNAELDFDKYIKIAPRKIRDWVHIDSYLFGDAGILNNHANLRLLNKDSWGSLRVDAGLGFALTIKKFANLEEIHPFTLRFDMPFYLSNTPYGTDNIAFRWVMGVNRNF
jgi:aminopeptidase N